MTLTNCVSAAQSCEIGSTNNLPLLCTYSAMKSLCKFRLSEYLGNNCEFFWAHDRLDFMSLKLLGK